VIPHTSYVAATMKIERSWRSLSLVTADYNELGGIRSDIRAGTVT